MATQGNRSKNVLNSSQDASTETLIPEPVPISLPSVRRKVLFLIQEIQKDVEKFKKKWMSNIDTDLKESWTEFVDAVLFKSRQLDKNTILDFALFIQLVDSVKAERNEELLRRPENVQLRRMITRDTELRRFILHIRQLLRIAVLDNLQKYCVSFSEEAWDRDLPSVQGHEEAIIGYRHLIDEDFDRIEVLDKELQRISLGLMSYIEEFDKVVLFMEDMMTTIFSICESAKRWLIADEHYPRKLKITINEIRLDIEKVKREIKYMQIKSDETLHLLYRRQHNTITSAQSLDESRMSEALAREDRSLVRKKVIVLGNELENKIDERKKVDDRICLMKFSTPRHTQDMMVQRSLLICETMNLERELEKLTTDLHKMERSKSCVESRVQDLEQGHETRNKEQFNMTDKLIRQQRANKDRQKHLVHLQENLEILKVIYNLKSNPENIKKIHSGVLHLGSERHMQERQIHERVIRFKPRGIDTLTYGTATKAVSAFRGHNNKMNLKELAMMWKKKSAFVKSVR